MEILQLDKPLVFFDIESTGVMPNRDRIVEIAVIKIMPDGERISRCRRINPEMPIPPSASAIHGITDADVADCPPFAIVADKLYGFIENCDLAGYNINGFDIPILQAEFKRAGLEFKTDGVRVVDVYNIFCKLYPRTLTAAYKFFCDKDLEGAHGALTDTEATLEVLAAQLTKHADLPKSVHELAAFCDMSTPDTIDKTKRFKWKDDEVIVNFGKNAGRTLKEIAAEDPNFLRWIIRSDFTDEVKTIANNALIGKFPVRES